MASIKVLIVEDESIIAHGLGRTLENLGYTVAAIVASGEEAIEKAGQLQPDLVLMDIVLRGEMDGIEAAEQIRAHWDIPVIYTTAYEGEEILQRARVTEPFGYILKPFERGSLHASIEMALYKHAMEARLKESEARYRAISDLVTDLAYALRVEPDGTTACEWMTEALTRITGFAPDELVEWDGWSHLAHPDDQALVLRHGEALLAGQADTAKFRIVTKEKTVRWLRDYGQPEWDESAGRVVRIIGATQDITEQVQAEEALRQAGEDLERRNRQLSQILTAGNLFRLDLGLEALLDELVQAARDALGFRMVVLNMVDQDNQQVYVQAHAGLDAPGKDLLENAVYSWDVFTQLLQEPFRVGQCYFIPQGARDWDQDFPGPVYGVGDGELPDDYPGQDKWLPGDALLIPIKLRQGQIIGVLSVDRPLDGQRPNGQTLQALEIFANQVAVAIENTQIYQAQCRLADHQATLYQVLRTVGGHLDAEMVIPAAVETIARLTGWPAISISMPDDTGTQLILRAAAGLASVEKGASLPVERGIIGRAFRSGQVQNVPNVDVDPDYVAGDRAICSELVVPLQRGGQVWGVLNVESDQPAAFDDDDVLLAESLAETIALALDNAQLHAEIQKQLREQTALREAVAAISSTLDLPSVLGYIAEYLARAVDASSAYINSFSAETHTSTVLAEYIGPAAGPEEKSDIGAIYEEANPVFLAALQARQPTVDQLDDPELSAYDRNHMRQHGVKSILHIPLYVGGKLLGYAEVWESRRRREFAAEEIALCQAIAQQAAVTIEKAAAYQREQFRVRQLQIINEVARQIVSILELDRLLDEVTHLIRQTFDYYYVEIALREGEELVFQRWACGRQEQVRHPPARRSIFDQGIMTWVARQGEPLLVPDVQQEPRFRFVPEIPDTVAELAVPLRIGLEILGVLDVQSDHHDQITMEQVSLLEILASQIAVALHNARSYDQQRLLAQRQGLLYEVLRTVSGDLDPETVAHTAVEVIARSTGWPAVDILLSDERSGRLVRRATAGRLSLGTGGSISPEQGVVGKAFLEAQTQYLPDVAADGHHGAGYSGIRSELAVPLRRGGRILGVIHLGSDQVTVFDREDILLAELLAEAIALALDRAQLYTETRRRLQEQTALREAVTVISSTLDLEAVLKYIADQMALAVGASGAHIYGIEDASPASIGTGLSKPQVFAGHLFLPLQIRDQVIGYAEVWESRRQREFTPEDIALCQSVAQQAAIAIENARLFQERAQRITELSILNQVGQALSSVLELAELLETVYQQVSRVFDTTNFYIALYYEGEDAWETILHVEEGTRVPSGRHKGGIGLTGYIIRQKAPLLFRHPGEIRAFHQAEGIAPLGRPALSWLGVPLIAANKVIGVMAIQSYEEANLYDEQDLSLFLTIAAQFAIAIERTRLYTETETERGKLEAILTDTADAVVVTDDDGRILLLNPAAEQVFGLQTKQAVGRPAPEVIRNPALAEFFERGRKGTPHQVAEIPIPEERTLYASLSRVKGVGYVAVLQDITHLKELDRMKSEFVSTVSHDLRNPLGAIMGYAGLLMETAEGEEKELVHRITEGANQMSDLIEDLLDLGKIEAGVGAERFPCHIEQIIDEAIFEASYQAELRGLSLTSSVPESLQPVLGDPRLLHQVLRNLIGNALKYTPAGGSIAVRAWQDNHRIIVEVQDSGIGIPREALPRIFEKFYRVSSSETTDIPGTGLGLAIVKAIVESHGGQVWVESELDQGSTFSFALPSYEQGSGSLQPDQTTDLFE